MRLIVGALLLALLLGSDGASAQDPSQLFGQVADVELTAGTPDVVMERGEMTNVELTLTNPAGNPFPADMTLSVAPGAPWSASFDRSRLQLAGGESATVTLTIQVPADQRADNFTVEVFAVASHPLCLPDEVCGFDAATVEVALQESTFAGLQRQLGWGLWAIAGILAAGALGVLLILLKARGKIILDASSVALRVEPGGTHHVTVTVRNTGQRQQRVSLAANDVAGWDLNVEPAELDLEGRSTGRAVLELQAPAGFDAPVQVCLAAHAEPLRQDVVLDMVVRPAS
ncbi:MAG: hypothetical protein ACPGQL_00085 [Thermoplasmatota archaeon]